MKLVLGAGQTRYEGWKHLDIQDGSGIDYLCDLNECKNIRLPIQDNTVEVMRMEHTFEHISNQLDLMFELWRIAQNNCPLWVTTPYGWSEDAWVDPTHVRPIFMRNYQYFSQPKYYGFDYGYRGDWRAEHFFYIFKSNEELKKIGAMISPSFDIDQYLRVNSHLISEIACLLVAIKPKRPARRELMTFPKQHLVSSPYSLETFMRDRHKYHF